MHALKRYPIRKNELLQAWDSADELILKTLHEMDLAEKRILIINDHFGALSDGLKVLRPTVFTDSYVSSQGIKFNLQEEIIPINQLEDLSGVYDLVIMKIPKNLSFFEDILCHLTHHLNSNSKVICGFMVKHLASSSFELIQKYIGVTTTSLAQKKARLIFANFEKIPVTSQYPISVKLEGFEKDFIHHSNLFSREKLDIGTRFLLEKMPQGEFERILDLGCANGVIGIKAKMLMPGAKIIFSDDSAMAISSARRNYQNYFADQAEFYWTNCYENAEKNSVDLILCNPPFHQSNTIGDFIALQMFDDAWEALSPGGLLRVIGNSHLGYQFKLKKIFGNSKIVATNNKFMIIDSIKK